MSRKATGSVLMILGTSIGAGMLALPVVSAHESFSISLLLLVASWLIMTLGALCLLEVNLWLPANTNMISMAGKTLGPWGKIITWVVYLLLLYSLICAYLSGLSDILQSLLANVHINLPQWSTTLISLVLFGSIVYQGIGSVDLINRGLMGIKLLAYAILVIVISQKINIHYALEGDFVLRNNTIMVMLTSFGFATIIPSLRAYLDSDKQLLKKVILLGSVLPLLVYIIWVFIVQALIPKTGSYGLISMLNSSHTNAMLMNGISQQVNADWLAQIAKVFVSICAVTSFLGVSICLTDFISDGLSITKKGKSGITVYGISYLPPLLIVLLVPGIFVNALSYAGILCLILLIIIPLLMFYCGYTKQYGKSLPILGKTIVLGILIISIILVGLNFLPIFRHLMA